MDPRLPQVSALAVAGDLVAGGVDVREGEVDTVGHERLDLDGRCVLPGFTDSHAHFLEWALERGRLELTHCASCAVVDGMAAANARGVVCVHDFQRSGGRDVWQRLDADRRLRLRVVMSFPLDMLPAARDLELRAGFGSRMLAIGPCKAFMDGTLGSRTAWMLDGSGDQLLSADDLAAGV